MTPQKVKEVLLSYRDLLRKQGYLPLSSTPLGKKAYDDTYDNIPISDVNKHLTWMCGQATGFLSGGHVGKAMRWLGFIQGVMWCNNMKSINQMRDDSRDVQPTPESKPTAKQGPVPNDLEDVFRHLDQMLTEEEKDRIRHTSEEKLSAQAHHGIGRWVRNTWGFWTKEGKLYEYMRTLGLRHPDDMSGLVITSYIRYIKRQDLEIDQQVKFYCDYWDRLGSPSHGMNIDE